MMLYSLDDVVKPRWLYLMNKANGINWKANVNTTWDVVEACNGKYANFGILVKIVDGYLVTLERVTKDEDDWLDAECVI